MLIPFLISKIHNARVTGAALDYQGSIAIDSEILKSARLKEFQKVEIYNVNNGARFSTYVIAGAASTGEIVVNGAAARLVSSGDKIIIAAYALVDEREFNSLNSVILLMGEGNKVEKILQHGI